MAFQADSRGKGFGHHPGEGMVGEAATISGAEDPAPGSEAGCSERHEFPVVFLSTEDLSPVVPRKGRRIQDDSCKASVLPGKTAQPVKGVTLAEVLGLGLNPVEGHIFPCPVEIRLGEIQGSGGGPTQGGADGEGARVGKGIEDGVTCLGAIPDANTVFTLIEEDALGVSRLETYQVANAAFPDLEGLRQFRAGNEGRRLLFLLVEMFPVGGDGRGKADGPIIQFR